MNSGIFFISPHPDDIAFSCFAKFRQSKAAISVLITIFSESNWSAISGFVPNLQDKITTIRRQEDVAFAERQGCRYIDLRLPDSSARGDSEDQRYKAHTNVLQITHDLVKEMNGIVRKIGIPKYVFLPLGLGNHIDHLITRDAGRQVFLNMSNLIFYEDLPYAFRLHSAAISTAIRSLDLETEPILENLSAYWTEKLEAIHGYQSQLGSDTVTRISTYARRISPTGGMAERYWRARPVDSDTRWRARRPFIISDARKSSPLEQ